MANVGSLFAASLGARRVESVIPPTREGERLAGALGGERARYLRRRLAAADAVAGSGSGVAAGASGGLPIEGIALAVAGLAVAWPTCALVCGLYSRCDLRTWASGVSDASRLLLGCLLLSWPLYHVLVVLGADSPVAGGLVGSATLAAFVAVLRTAVRTHAHRSRAFEQRTIIVGSGVVAARLVERLRSHDELSLTPVGFVDDGPASEDLLGVPWLGELEALGDLIRDEAVDRVMIAFSRVGHRELLACVRVCRDAGVAVDVVPRLFEFLDSAPTVDHIGGLPLLSIDAHGLSPVAQVAKRTLDVIGAALALLVLGPGLVLIAVAIKLDSPGPVLFVQPRAGRRGRFFALYKFRSMHLGSQVLVRTDGAIVKAPDDSRVTRVGRILRRFSVDEAPQLFNVLLGDMSLVGPRPLVAAEAQALSESWQARRADLRPGLTGPWQVSGRSHIPFDEMIRFDYQYVAGWSLARDLEILLATVPAVLSGRGAY
jgi:exopolysaccharide biosynthesis polyprenyl glycosylphosphotransferase